MMMQSLPALARSNAAAAAILDLDARLAQGAGEGTAETAQAQGPVLPPMESIALHHARFVHEDAQAQSSFILGPVNVVIERGQIVFINGGNGSGKSTLVKMLLGLYPLHEGTLRLNGRPVDSGELSAYREQFSAIFSDFQLFRTLYGLQNPDRMKCTELLELFELAAKVRLNGNRFDTVDLSSGQRKRLALVAALLEDRPVIVLDEWAADQDPEFRRKFYRELLPLLKQQGKTIIAVTHDDNYYDVADRRITLSEGRVAAES
jgi:putative ATP-binding cassette transporter